MPKQKKEEDEVKMEAAMKILNVREIIILKLKLKSYETQLASNFIFYLS